MTRWPPWDPVEHPDRLLQYVQQDAVSLLLPHSLASEVPGPSDTGPLPRLRKLVEVFLRAGISYSNEPTSSPRSQQHIRPPDQVLVRPRRATCLDLAVTFAGACLDAALHPLIVIADPDARGEARHAVVVVWLRGNWEGQPAAGYPLREAVHRGIPREVAEGLRRAVDMPGDFLAIDLTAVIGDMDLPDPFSRAVRAGASVIADAGQWTGKQTIDIGARYAVDEAFSVMPAPDAIPVRPPYLDLDVTASPLQQMRARNGRVPFQRRDELDILRDWCESADAQAPPQVRVLHGPGGAGKTHLAAELASRLTAAGWYAGFLARSPQPDGLRWLGDLVSPLLVVVDYPEATRAADVVALVKALQDRPAGPACILLVARTLGPWWQRDIVDPLHGDGYRYHDLPPIKLAGRHPQARAVYHRALHAFAPLATDLPASLPAAESEWTTLDLIMLGWLTAQSITELPRDRGALYGAVLDGELRYWGRAIAAQAQAELPDPVLQAIGACLTLLAPEPPRVASVLQAIGLLRRDARWRQSVADVMIRLLPPDPEDGTVAVRPDPVGDHLLLTAFAADPGLLVRAVRVAAGDERLGLCLSLTRAAHSARGQAAELAEVVLRTDGTLWRPALSVVAAQGGGPFESALARHTESGEATELVAELVTTPAGHATLRGLALLAAQRQMPDPASADPGNPAELAQFAEQAARSNNLSIRQADMGLRQDALHTAERAVHLYRALTRVDPETFADQLASVLNNLAGRQAAMGLRADSLTSLEEALRLYRALADEDRSFLPQLTVVLHNMALRQGELGRHHEALASIDGAVRMRRELVAAATADELSERQADLASALDNQAVRRAALGRRRAALDSATESVDLHRQLANRRPGRFSHALAVSLDTLSVRLAEVGRFQDALQAASEAVIAHRRLAADNADAFNPALAMSVENLAVRQAAVSLAAQALMSAREAVSIRRELAGTQPAAFTPNLAAALVTLANCHSENGDHEQARAAAAEAVALLRSLAEPQHGAFSGDLAAALNNLAVHQAELGNGQVALGNSAEAVEIRRALAVAEPGSHHVELASSLTNLSNLQADAGHYEEALASAREAVSLLRPLHEENPLGIAWNLATALTSLTHQLAAVGQLAAALDTAHEATALTASLAEADITAYGHQLGIVLTNLANRQAAVGQREEALRSVEQAAHIYRTLAAEQPRRFRHDLAKALNNLANYQADAGLAGQALSNAEEALALRGTEQAEATGAFPGDLATVLHTLALLQSNTGIPEAALSSITEEVEILRSLASPESPPARSDLAGALNNLAAVQAQLGELSSALATAEEVIELRRTLAAENPGAHLSSLASALANLAHHRASLGLLTEAAQAADEAVGIYRTLSTAAAGPTASELSIALVNQAAILARLNQPDRALASAAEAVAIRRALVRAFPATELPGLMRAINQEASLHEAQHDAEAAIQVYTDGMDQLPALAQAELLAARALRRLARGDDIGAGADLAAAARTATAAGDPPGIGHARRAIRQAAQQLTGNPAVLEADALPAWATEEIPQVIIELADKWIGCNSVMEQADLLRDSVRYMLTPQSQASLAAAYALNPGHHDLGELLDLLAAAEEQGIEQALGQWVVRAQAEAALTVWMTIPSWPESLAYIREHPGFLEQPGLWELLESHQDEPLISVHLSVARLTRRIPLPDLSGILSDPDMAADAAIDAFEQAELGLAADLLIAVPALASTFAGKCVTASLCALRPDLLRREHGDMVSSFEDAVQSATPLERSAGTARLRRLARQRPDWSGPLDPLITCLEDA